MIILRNVPDFNTDHIFDCGQCFRWTREEDGSYTGVAFGRVLNVKTESADSFEFNTPSGVNVILEGATQVEYEEIWHQYLDMDRDYGQIKRILAAQDPVMAMAIEHGYGIRILNQDKWETIVSFLISQNNNIPRIKKCIESLCENFGQYLGEFRGKAYYDFPGPEVLAGMSASDLSVCRLGYRARYIIEAARQVMSSGIEDTFPYLNTLCGVGPKVANCILLFSMMKIDRFPIDVWVKRVMHQLYGIDEEDTKAMQEYADHHFGEYGGIAQQYLFYYIREGQK